MSIRKIRLAVKQLLEYISQQFPNVHIIWSLILPRFSWVSHGFVVHCHVLLSDIQIQRGAVCGREDKRKMVHQPPGKCLCPEHQMLYREAFGGRSWTFKMKQFVWKDIVLDNYNTYLDELRLEQHSILQSENDKCVMVITPFILVNMLEFFCCKQTDSNRAQTILDEFQSGMQNVEGAAKLHWQILGICQQMAGNHHAALHSYLQSLQEVPDPNIESATLLRIQDLYIS